MPFCSFSEGAAMFDVTPVENMFLLEYLPTAPDGYLRVYLYARMLCLHPELGGEISDLARALRMEEEAVYNAFQYWEQQGLVEKLSDHPASYAICPLRSGAAVRAEADRDYYKYREYNASLQELFGTELLEPRHYKIANDWLNVLGFSQEAALKILEFELRLPGGKKANSVFRRADKRAVEWAERGIHSAQDVQRAIEYDDQVYDMASAVMKQLSMNRKPTANELDCVRRWIRDWKLTKEDVLRACGQTTRSRAPSIAYLDAILKEQAVGGGEHFAAVKAVLRELGAGGAVPTPDQMKKYAALLAAGFEPETILLAAVQCARKRKNSFEELEWMLGKWGEAGVRTRTQAEKYISDMNQATRQVRAVLEEAGLSRRPTMDDLDKHARWRAAFSDEMIDCAAQCARGARNPMQYMDKLFRDWAEAGVATPEEARARGAAHAWTQKSAGVPAVEHNYQQHSYTEADFGDDFYYDPARDYGEGDEA